jgi:hypothetical protein
MVASPPQKADRRTRGKEGGGAWARLPSPTTRLLQYHGDAMNRYPTFRALRHIARSVAVVNIVALVSGCAAKPRTSPDPLEAAAIFRDGQLLLAPPSSSAGNRPGIAPRPAPMAEADTQPQEEDRR